MRSTSELAVNLETPGVTWSVAVLDCSTSRSFVQSPDRVLSSASVGKLLLLAEVARQLVSGDLDADTVLQRTPDDSVSDSGLWQHLHSDSLSVTDAAVLVAAVSDNLATNVLLRTVGLARVQQLGEELGFSSFQLHDRVRDARTREHPPRLSSASAHDLVQYFDLLEYDRLVSAPVSAKVGRWLSLNADLSMVASAFSCDPLAHSHSALLNKTGTDDGVRADCGRVVGGRGAVVYAAIANWELDAGDRVDGVLGDMSRIGAFVRSLAGSM